LKSPGGGERVESIRALGVRTSPGRVQSLADRKLPEEEK